MFFPESWKRSLDNSQLGSTAHGDEISLNYTNNHRVTTNNNYSHLTEGGTT